ncbi:hypothetical protein [Seonamhaeicola sp.]|uniref:hypothetical protein n=1 Tax=Seonamhaeicola sp. TaxID=1912245 RepID=UPI00356AFDE3
MNISEYQVSELRICEKTNTDGGISIKTIVAVGTGIYLFGYACGQGLYYATH